MPISRTALRRIAAASTALLLWVQPAHAQSILRDAETETLFNDMSAPLIRAAGLAPKDVQIVLINDDSINAFVVGGQAVYIHSGLIQAADNANQVQGVIAHELGHIADGHAINDGGARPAMGIYLLSLVLGIAAMAAGSGEAGAGILGAGQQAALGKYLAFTRVQESTADASAVKFLGKAGISGKGMLSFFKTIQQQEYRYGLANIDPFMQSHPLSGDRIQTLTADIQASPAYTAKPDPALEDRFRRVKAKLEGYVATPTRTLTDYPESDQSLYGHYARAYAYHKGGYPQKADAEADALIKAMPERPLFPGNSGPDIARGGQAEGRAGAATRGGRGHAQQSADRDDPRPCVDRDRGQDQLRGSPARAAHRDCARRRESVRLVSARHRLRTDRRHRACRARHRGTRKHDRRHPHRRDQRALCDGGHPAEHARLDSRAGHRAHRAERDRRQSQEVQAPVSRLLLTGVVLLGVLFGAGGMWFADRVAPGALGTADKAKVERVVRDYVLANPDIVAQAMQKLQERESARLIAASRGAIETPYGSAWIGNPRGDVTLVEYFDYNCGFCRASLPMIDRLVADDPELRIVFRELPVLSEESGVAARASLAAAAQGKFRRFHDALYAAGPVSAATIAGAARAAGVDSGKVPADVDDELRTNLGTASRLGMTGTPSWVVGNRMLVGAVPIERLKEAIAATRAES